MTFAKRIGKYLISFKTQMPGDWLILGLTINKYHGNATVVTIYLLGFAFLVSYNLPYQDVN